MYLIIITTIMIKTLALLAFVLARFHGSDSTIFLTTFPGIFRMVRQPTHTLTPTTTRPLGVRIVTESGVRDVCGNSTLTASEGTYVDVNNVNDDDKNYNKVDNINDDITTTTTTSSTTSSSNNDGIDIQHHHHHPEATSNITISDEERRLIQAMQSAIFPCTITYVKQHKPKHNHKSNHLTRTTLLKNETGR